MLKHLTDVAQATEAHLPLSQRKHAFKQADSCIVDRECELCCEAVASHGKHYPARPVQGHDARPQAIQSCHGLSYSGMMRTAALVSERYYWGGIVEDCRKYIQGCHPCKLQNARFSKLQELHSIPVADQSFHCIGIDLIGPYRSVPPTTSTSLLPWIISQCGQRYWLYLTKLHSVWLTSS